MSETLEDKPILETEAEAPDPGIVVPDDAPAPAQKEEHDRRRDLVAGINTEREKRQRAEARARELEAMVDRGQQRVEELVRLATAPQAKEAAPELPPIPDMATDPVGHFAASKAHLEARQRAIEERQARIDQQASAQSQEGEFLNRYIADSRSFAQQSPDFTVAYDFLTRQYMADLQAAGFDPQEAMQQLQAFEKQAAAKAWQQGRSASEAMYKLALQRGFKTQLKNGSTPGQDGPDELDVIEAGQRSGRSLSTGAGATDPLRNLSYKQLLAMSEDEYGKVADSIRRKALGG